MPTYLLRMTSDGTLLVMVRREREYISIDKPSDQLFQVTRVALISKGVSVNDELLRRDLADLGFGLDVCRRIGVEVVEIPIADSVLYKRLRLDRYLPVALRTDLLRDFAQLQPFSRSAS
jgi:hypothetical protein